mgnify:FL=1
MKQVRVIIERGNDGNFSCFVSDETPLKNGILGYGNTVQEAKDDFISAYNEAIKMFNETPNVEFSFVYDIVSFLQEFSKKLSLAGLQTITGINRKQLSHYVNGKSKPSKATVKKISEGINKFQQELQDISFV